MAADKVTFDEQNLNDGERRLESMARYTDLAVDKVNTILASPVKPGEFVEGRLLRDHVVTCADAYLERLRAWDGFREQTGRKVHDTKRESLLVEERSAEQADLDIVRDAGREVGATPTGTGSIDQILNGKDAGPDDKADRGTGEKE